MKKVLILDDSKIDQEFVSEIVLKTLKNIQLLFSCNEKDFLNNLKEPDIILVISDFSMPLFSGLEALNYCKDHYPEIPFIFVTGTIGDEELAAETLLSGASGFVLKNNLNKLSNVLCDILPSEVNANDSFDKIAIKNIISNVRISYDLLRRLNRKFGNDVFLFSQSELNQLLLIKDTLNRAVDLINNLNTHTFISNTKNEHL